MIQQHLDVANLKRSAPKQNGYAEGSPRNGGAGKLVKTGRLGHVSTGETRGGRGVTRPRERKRDQGATCSESVIRSHSGSAEKYVGASTAKKLEGETKTQSRSAGRPARRERAAAGNRRAPRTRRRKIEGWGRPRRGEDRVSDKGFTTGGESWYVETLAFKVEASPGRRNDLSAGTPSRSRRSTRRKRGREKR